jgi:hypothetical protein
MLRRRRKPDHHPLAFNYRHRFLILVMLFVVGLLLFNFTRVPHTVAQPPLFAPVLPGEACAIDWYYPDGTVENRFSDPCPDRLVSCPFGRAGDPISGDTWCAADGGGGPLPPPNLPGLSVGASCIAGTSRSVSATSEGDSQQIRRFPGGAVVGNPHTFTDMLQGVDYQFEVKAEGPGGSSGWGNRTGIVRHDQSPPTTTLDLVGTAGNSGWWRSAVSAALLPTDVGCLGVDVAGGDVTYTLDGVFNTYSGNPFTITGEGSHTLSYASTDGAHPEALNSTTVFVDTVAPSITMTTDRPADSASGWWRSPVTVTISTSDATSGVLTVDSNHNALGWLAYSAPITLSADQIHTLDGRGGRCGGLAIHQRPSHSN